MSKFICPNCSSGLSDIKETRHHNYTVGDKLVSIVIRIRGCVHCGTRYNTYEKAVSVNNNGHPNDSVYKLVKDARYLLDSPPENPYP